MKPRPAFVTRVIGAQKIKQRDRDGKPFFWACKCGAEAPFYFKTTRRWSSGAERLWFRDVCGPCAARIALRFGLDVPEAPR